MNIYGSVAPKTRALANPILDKWEHLLTSYSVHFHIQMQKQIISLKTSQRPKGPSFINCGLAHISAPNVHLQALLVSGKCLIGLLLFILKRRLEGGAGRKKKEDKADRRRGK